MLDGWGVVHEGAEDAGDRGGVMGGKGFLMNRSPLSSGFWCGGGRVWSLDVGEI